VIERGDEGSRPGYVLDPAWGNDPIVAEMAIKPGVIEKIGSLFGDPIDVYKSVERSSLSSALRAGVWCQCSWFIS